MVVCSPIPHEDLKRPELPDGSATNANLKLYMEVMREESEKGGVRYVDLFGPLSAAMASSSRPLTINGIHLNRRGYEVLGGVLDVSLFGPRSAEVAVDMQALVAAVAEKNLQFFYDHRAVNGYYIYGGRKNPYGVVNFPEEFAKLRKMVAVRDQQIWDIAQGKPVPEKIDDSQTGGLSTIDTNYAGKVKLLTPEESREQFVLTDGFEIELVVSEQQFPEMTKPVAMDIDARGRLWVTTNPSYPQYLPGTPPDDKILIYEDVDGDGRADKQTIFADKLHLPIGIALGDGGAYVSQQPGSSTALTPPIPTIRSARSPSARTGLFIFKKGPSITRRSRRRVGRSGCETPRSFVTNRRRKNSASSSRTTSPTPGGIASTAGAKTSSRTLRPGPITSRRPLAAT
jgi:hypothetical protein